MPMKHNGLNKLSEECCELTVVCQKWIACNSDEHWSGDIMRQRMIEEIGDVLAAIDFVVNRFGLSNNIRMPVDESIFEVTETIQERRVKKLAIFNKWDEEQEPQ